jgi:hypothetical protein
MQRPTATITVQRHTATTDARLQSLLSTVLSRRVRAFTPGGHSGYQQHFETDRYFHVDSQGRLITYAGLVPRAEECLRQAGYDVTIVDRTLWPVFAGADQAMLQRSELSVNDKSLLAAIADHPRGQVLLDKPAELPRALALVCCFFSEARVLVVAKSRKDAEHVQDGLRKYIDGAVNLGSEVDWTDQHRLLVVQHTLAVRIVAQRGRELPAGCLRTATGSDSRRVHRTRTRIAGASGGLGIDC